MRKGTVYRVILFCLTFFSTQLFASAQIESNKAHYKLAQAQLDAYNSRDVDAFLKPYAEDVKVYTFPNTLMYEGKEEMRSIYGRMFARTPDLFCKLTSRMVLGNTVIDQEEVTLVKGDKPMKAIAIYKIKGEKIAEVYFIHNN